MVGAELHEGPVEQGVVVLEAVGLVHHQHRPTDGPEEGLVLQEDLIGGENGIELQLPVGVGPLVFSNLQECREWPRIKGCQDVPRSLPTDIPNTG